MRKSILLFLALCAALGSLNARGTAAGRDFYQLKIYHLKNEQQELVVENFLQQAFIPALHRAGIAKVGVFKPVETTPAEAGKTPERLIYVFIPFPSYAKFDALEQTLEKDKKYLADGTGYLDAVLANPPYERIETILLNAFTGSTHFNLPVLNSPKKDRIYELRNYEGPTEKLHRNKVQMFNQGDEIGLFKKLNFNAVFYGQVIAGSRMPNLMYLTTYENLADRDAHWKAFFGDDHWKKLSAMTEYQGNVSRNESRFLYPVEYSDI